MNGQGEVARAQGWDRGGGYEVDVGMGEVVRVCVGRWGYRVRIIPGTVMVFTSASTGMNNSETFKKWAVKKIAVSPFQEEDMRLE